MRSHRTKRTILTWFTTPLLSAAALLVACDRDADLPTGPAPSMDLAQDLLPPEVEELLKVQLERFSTMPMLITAKQLGVTEIQGKSINAQNQNAQTSPKRLIDVPIATDPVAHENEPTVATSPKDKKLLVAGYHFITNTVRCHARHSSDGGMSWSAPFLMMQLPGGQCSDPVLAYAPDGSRVFYAYMDVKGNGDYDILVSYSDDNGATWTGPFIALDGVAGVFLYDKPWIGTPDDAANYVYVTATRFDQTGVGLCHIVFTRSTNGGTAYGAPQTLDMSTAGCGVGPSPVVQGSRPSGGKQGNVLVAWFNSGTDGWLTGSFKIRIAHSANFGASFGPAFDAVNDLSETPFWKGPFACYHRWWGSMFPDVEIDPSQGGHLAYTHDPVPGTATAEDGNIRYAESPGPPYTSWSSPETVNDDGTASAQGYVAMDIMTEQTGQSSKPHLIWMDDRLPVAAAPQCAGDVENLFYDIFYSTRQDGGWSPNNRVTDASSLSDFIFVGDYNDLSTDNGSLYSVWTDRRDKLSIFDLEDDVWGSRTHRTQTFALASP
jgi:hypothetical protein